MSASDCRHSSKAIQQLKCSVTNLLGKILHGIVSIAEFGSGSLHSGMSFGIDMDLATISSSFGICSSSEGSLQAHHQH